MFNLRNKTYLKNKSLDGGDIGLIIHDRFLTIKAKNFEFYLSKIKSKKKSNKFEQNTNLSFNQNLLKEENNKNYDDFIENSILKVCKNDDNENNKYKFNFEENIDEPIIKNESKLNYRKINESVYKVLDAPGIKDDYYTNILDWNDKNFVLISLNHGIFLWCPKTCKPEKIYPYEHQININFQNISSLKSMDYINILIVGFSNGNIKYIDYKKKCEIYSNNLGCSRIASLDCSGNLISFGNKKGNLFFKDFRENKLIKNFNIHSQEICKVKFSEDSNYLASGGNDNLINIFDLRKMKTIYKNNKHLSGVRAISWSNKKRNIIFSGGGTNDKTIKIWDLRDNMSLINSINTGSQVCNLIHSKNTNELISSHGYNDNNICIWNINDYNLEKVAILKSNSDRVLHLSISPCGENLVSGSGDQSLRFFNPFPSKQKDSSWDLEKYITNLR